MEKNGDEETERGENGGQGIVWRPIQFSIARIDAPCNSLIDDDGIMHQRQFTILIRIVQKCGMSNRRQTHVFLTAYFIDADSTMRYTIHVQVPLLRTQHKSRSFPSMYSYTHTQFSVCCVVEARLVYRMCRMWNIAIE